MTNSSHHSNPDHKAKGPCYNCAFKSKLFRLLSRAELELMNTGRHEVIYNPGETIFKQGTPLTHVLSFNHGLAKMQVEGASGSRIILRLVKPVEFICGMGLFSDHRNQYSLMALERSSVCYIDKDNFRKVLHRNETFMEAFLQHLEEFQSRTLQKMINMNQKHTMGRVAEALLYLTDDVYAAEAFESHLSTTELSELAGISRESAFKALSDFSNMGIISRDGSQVVIKNRNLLQKMNLNG